MSRDPELDKRSDDGRPLPPRMLGDTDVRVIMEQVEKLPEGASILEVGPWLGGLTRLLAPHGTVTVVDNFLWTPAHDRNYPGIAAPEANFRHIFQANMDAEGVRPSVIEADFADFEWPGGDLDCVVIDAPRTAREMHGCFRAFAPSLREGATILVKHALNTRGLGLGAYVDAIIGAGYFEMVSTGQPNWCNIAVLKAAAQTSELAAIEDPQELIANAPMSARPTDPWYGNLLSNVRVAYLAQTDCWEKAFARLSEMEANSVNLTQWDDLEPLLFDQDDLSNQSKLAVLSEVVWLTNDARLSGRRPVDIDAILTSRIKSYWLNNAGADWVHEKLDVSLIATEEANNLIAKLAPFTAKIFQANVIEVGEGLGAGAVACVLAGAQSYVGVEQADKTELFARIESNFPHISSHGDDDAAVSALKAADVIIVNTQYDAKTPLGAVLASRTAKKSGVTVIRV